MIKQDQEARRGIVPASIPIATDKVDFASLPLMKKIREDHALQRQAMMQHLRRRREAERGRQIEVAAHYNAAHEHAQAEGEQGILHDVYIFTHVSKLVCTA